MLFLCGRSWFELVHSGTCFLEVSSKAVYVDPGIHIDVEVHNDISLTGSLTAFFWSTASCGAQWFSGRWKSSRWRPEYQGDGDITENHKRWCVICLTWSTVPRNNLCFFDRGCRKTRPSHSCDLLHSKGVPMDPEVGAGSQHEMGREKWHTEQFVMRE